MWWVMMDLYLRLFSKELLLLSDFGEHFFEQLIGAEGRDSSKMKNPIFFVRCKAAEAFLVLQDEWDR
jgi:hypothetical protein